MRPPEITNADRDPKARRRFQIICVGALVVIGYLLWFLVLRHGALNESARHRAAFSDLEREFATLKLRSTSMLGSGANAQELDAEIVAMRQRIASLQSQLPADAERLATLDRELEEMHNRLSAIAADRVTDERKPRAPRNPPRISLINYAQQNYGSTDVRSLGFSQEAADRFYLVLQTDLFSTRRVRFLSGESDGERSFGITLPSSLTPKHAFRPLASKSREQTVRALTAFQSQFSEPVEINIATCPGITACDAFVKQVQEICEEVGFKVTVSNLLEVPMTSVRSTNSAFHMADSSKINAKLSDFIQAFKHCANVLNEPAVSAGRFVAHESQQSTISLLIFGFPRFDDHGFASFDQ